MLPYESHRGTRSVRVATEHGVIRLGIEHGPLSARPRGGEVAGMNLRPDEARELAWALMRHAASLGWSE